VRAQCRIEPINHDLETTALIDEASGAAREFYQRRSASYQLMRIASRVVDRPLTFR
jgi:hypothetical protein